MLASGSVQEIMDLAGIAHLSAIKSRFLFFIFLTASVPHTKSRKLKPSANEDMAG